MDEIELSRKQVKGARAKELFENELLQEAFTKLHSEYIDAWKLTHFKNAEGRERLWQAIQIVGKVQDHLKKMISDGKMATRDLAQISHPKR